MNKSQDRKDQGALEAQRAAREAEKIEKAKKRELKARERLAKIEAGEFGFLVRYEKREDADPVETPLAQEFWEILSRMEMSEEERAHEERFVCKVSEALSRHEDKDPIKILWDVDDTMGQNDQNRDFQFRPTFLPMLELIRAKYKNAQHGIISDRQDWSLAGNEKVMDAVNKRWPINEDLILSTLRDIPEELSGAMGDCQYLAGTLMDFAEDSLPENEAEKEWDRLRGLLGSMPELHAGKMAALHDAGLLEDEMLIVVDDYNLPLYLGDRGVYVDYNARYIISE